MNWKELTSHQKLCKVQLTPETTLVQIYQMVAELKNPFGSNVPKPWKRNSVAFTWNIEPGYVLKIHAQMYLHMD